MALTRWYIQTFLLPAPCLPTDTPASFAERPGTQFWTWYEAESAEQAWNAAKPRLLPRLREVALAEGERWHIEVYSLAQIRATAYERASNPQHAFRARWMGSSAREIALSASSFVEVIEDTLARFQAFDEVLPVIRLVLRPPTNEKEKKEASKEKQQEAVVQ